MNRVYNILNTLLFADAEKAPIVILTVTHLNNFHPCSRVFQPTTTKKDWFMRWEQRREGL